jgi:hypothetical protein
VTKRSLLSSLSREAGMIARHAKVSGRRESSGEAAYRQFPKGKMAAFHVGRVVRLTTPPVVWYFKESGRGIT